MSDNPLNDVFNNLLVDLTRQFVFALSPAQLTLFLDHYRFDYSQRDLARLISLCSLPVDMNVFAGACYMCTGSECKLDTQRAIFEALIAFKNSNFAF